ncbi:HEAT repeat domain-containing protein [Sporosarcina siberiensis]|uniref:HEAT repeat domain-containing protein n=1 Tax=Sporosarcina siberiensis TaxID=1365606 RepID=A0ABW4SI49_9BACL
MKTKKYILETKDLWFQYLIDGQEMDEKLRPVTRFQQDAANDILVHYAKNISDAPVLKRITIFVEEHLEMYYRDQIHSKSWSVRMNVLHKIFDFKMEFLLKEVLMLLDCKKHKTNEEYLLMYKIVLVFDIQLFIEKIMNPKYELGEYDYKKLFIDIDEDRLDLLVQREEELSRKLTYVLIEVIGVKHLIDYLPFLESKLEAEDPEIRIKALKSIARIGYISDIEHYEPFMDGDTWEERLMLAKILAFAPIEKAIALSTVLVEDSSWEVRKQAELTLEKVTITENAYIDKEKEAIV